LGKTGDGAVLPPGAAKDPKGTSHVWQGTFDTNKKRLQVLVNPAPLRDARQFFLDLLMNPKASSDPRTKTILDQAKPLLNRLLQLDCV
jgi:hypothetical protein